MCRILRVTGQYSLSLLSAVKTAYSSFQVALVTATANLMQHLLRASTLHDLFFNSHTPTMSWPSYLPPLIRKGSPKDIH